MTDVDLIVFGAIVSFVAVGGAYVYLRERYEDTEQPAELETATKPVTREAA
jgi:hypothetical protein